MHKILASIALAGVLALSLSACTGSTNTAAACTVTKSGTSSEKVKVKGKVGKSPTVTFSTPISSKKTERSVVTKGKGAVAVKGSTVTADYTAYNATTGKKIDASPYTKDSAAQFTLDTNLLSGLKKAIQCSKVGDRVVAVIPPADAFKSAGQTDLGIGAKDSLIFVIDVEKVVKPVKALAKANGRAVAPKEGLPTVTLAKSGEPTITVPATAAPTTLIIQDLKKGTGATVKDGATVTVHYVGVIWATGKVFDSSWSRGTPASFTTTGVVTGFGKALVGQKVGSQVLAIIPPADGYADSPPADSGISATDDLVFVIDILATQ